MRKKTHYSGGRNGGSNNNNNNKRRFTRKSGGHGGGGRFGGGDNDSDSVNPRMRKQAQTNRDKYQAMAKDALSSGDRVESEYYLQHADHYLRILNAIDAQFTPRQPSPERADNGGEEGETGAEVQAEEASDEAAPVRERPARAKPAAQERAARPETEANDDGAQLASVLPAPKMAGL